MAGLSTKSEWVAKKVRVDREVKHAADWRVVRPREVVQ